MYSYFVLIYTSINMLTIKDILCIVQRIQTRGDTNNFIYINTQLLLCRLQFGVNL